MPAAATGSSPDLGGRPALKTNAGYIGPMTFADLTPLLAASRATAAFRDDLEAFAAGATEDRIEAPTHNPRVKVLRVVAQLLAAEPELAVDQVRIRAASGCADYVGRMDVQDATGRTHTFEFVWNCEWKARQMGYVDAFGLPDQIRAAREFGWRCFERWSRVDEAGAQQAA